ncbi:WYL domain-containing protein [Neobacillus vireti]|uniref:helix-turn-helix transcriptional regulator n=1 Tax=Neobacillus vireti TaxID=220686 RepID=UPI003000E6EA
MKIINLGLCHPFGCNRIHRGPCHKVTLKISKHILEYLRRAFPIVHQTSTIQDEWMEVQVEVLGYDGIMFWILQQAELVEVLGPVELREKVREKITRMHGIYQKSQPLA